MRHPGQDGWSFPTAASLRPFRLSQPRSLQEARLLAGTAGGTPPTWLAGGTDLVAAINEGLQPRHLVALHRIGELRQVSRDGDSLGIGAMVTHQMGAGHPLIRRHLPGFAAAWERIANVRIRLRGTIGGNLMARRTRYELPILLAALDAEAEFLSGSRLPVHRLAAAEARGDLLTAIHIPLRGETLFHYERSLRPLMTQALSLRRDGASTATGWLALGTEFIQPALLAVRVSPGQSAEAAADAAFAALPAEIGDAAASNSYIRRAGRNLLVRQLNELSAG